MKNLMGIKPDKDLLLTRFYLTSSRSFKKWIRDCRKADSDLKNIILATSMPKFIWVTEISDQSLFSQNSIKGMIVIDATGNATSDSFLFGFNNGQIFLKFKNAFNILTGNFNEMPCYKNNLKGRWCQWKA